MAAPRDVTMDDLSVEAVRRRLAAAEAAATPPPTMT